MPCNKQNKGNINKKCLRSAKITPSRLGIDLKDAPHNLVQAVLSVLPLVENACLQKYGNTHLL